MKNPCAPPYSSILGATMLAFLIATSLHGQETRSDLKAPLWQQALLDTVRAPIARALLTPPIYEGKTVTMAVDSLGSHEVFLVRGRVASGTGFTEDAFFVVRRNNKFPPTILWSGLARREEDDGTNTVSLLESCIYVDGSSIVYVPVVRLGSSSSVHSSKWWKRPGYYTIADSDPSKGLVYRAPAEAAVMDRCHVDLKQK